jgi:hypothetical protein
MVVLSTSEAVSDLLDQRSAIYSDKVRASPSMHVGSQPLTVSSQATHYHDGVVSPFDRLHLIDLTCLLCVTQDGSH